ncbi:hypothetical protein Bca101_093057 [Brassica carinata]
MAKKKPPKGKPPNRSTTHPGSASRSTSASKPRAVSPHAAGSDSATGKVDPGFPPVKDAQTTATVVDLAMEIENPNLENLATESNAVPRPTVPDTTVDANTGKETGTDLKPSQDGPTSNGSSPAELWKGFVKEASIKLQPKEKPFLLDSGEPCVTIPNAVVEKNKKAWECFILGQFYNDAPARGAVHAIVNGIWSKHRRDITVSKMDNQAFLFRVPCPHARRRILAQNFWQIDGQTMFVAKWSPGLQQVKPELEMVPVWLELRRVPLQFFNQDALQEIAGIVGHPVCLHPSTEQLIDIEVAKVYTVIDPRKPLPNFVNARFESGDTRRISVSSPFMPSLCSFCKKVGHTISRCKDAPKTCTLCNSVKHLMVDCSRYSREKARGKAHIKSLLPIVSQTKKVYRPAGDKNKGETASSSVPPARTDIPSERSTPARANSPLLRTTPPSLPHRSNLENRQRSVSPISHHAQRVNPHSQTLAVETNDLVEGRLVVDLTSYSSKNSISSGHVSDGSNFSGDEDPGDGDDKYIEVISRRMKKQLKGKARAGDPLIL